MLPILTHVNTVAKWLELALRALASKATVAVAYKETVSAWREIVNSFETIYVSEGNRRLEIFQALYAALKIYADIHLLFRQYPLAIHHYQRAVTLP